jgi:hypothetical protein
MVMAAEMPQKVHLHAHGRKYTQAQAELMTAAQKQKAEK